MDARPAGEISHVSRGLWAGRGTGSPSSAPACLVTGL